MDITAFDNTEFEKAKKQYTKETEERWGSTKEYTEYLTKTKDYKNSDWSAIMLNMDSIFESFSNLKENDPGSSSVQSLVKDWQNHVTNNYYYCTNEILAYLGELYRNDEHFMKNIDQKFRKGTAAFISQAIEIYCR